MQLPDESPWRFIAGFMYLSNLVLFDMKRFTTPILLLLSGIILVFLGCKPKPAGGETDPVRVKSAFPLQKAAAFTIAGLPVPQVSPATPANIIDFFVALPEAALEFLPEERKNLLRTYPMTTAEAMDSASALFQNGVGWKLDSLDLQNAYLSFHTLGDGEGKNFEVTYYNKADGSRLLVVGKTRWSMTCDLTDLVAFHFSADTFTDVTADVFPTFRLQDFMDEKFDPGKIKAEYNLHPFLYYKLPQQGKHIHALLDDCMEVDWPQSDSAMLNYVFERWKYTGIRMDWNGEKFVIGKKIENNY
jgi:hypothetical protein